MTFDVFARAVNLGPAQQVQVSKERGADIDPSPPLTRSGRVWIAWQGWRDGVAAIYAVHQDGKGFSKPEKISNSNAGRVGPRHRCG